MLALFAPFPLLVHAHAHNDYAHPRPLLDALEQGFLSVEVDVFLVDGEFRVGHNRAELKPGRTLESLYLDPLAERVRRNKGRVCPGRSGGGGTLALMIDLKEDGARLEPELVRHLAKYRRMLSDRTGSTVNARAVQVILSGARTEECASGDGVLFKDGRVENMDDPASRTPWISGQYSAVLRTNASPLPLEPRVTLMELVRRTHRAGKRLRLWGAPDGPTTWTELRDARVDLLNTDRLAEMRTFLLQREPSSTSKTQAQGSYVQGSYFVTPRIERLSP